MQDRCAWCGDDPLYIDYHDREWGVPCRDSRELFALLMLESFQAGLSWITILRKRENFYARFANFAPNILASWGEAEIEAALQDAGIIRHRAKIVATINGAKAWQEIEAGEGFSNFIWQAVNGAPVDNRVQTLADVPASTAASTLLSKRLKKAGFNFCGPVICYAFMQAAGLVNDHVVTCPRHGAV
ncbi:MAG: DNA-3-methyladenine glycosylase I [Paracoccaceae bacterium]